MSRAIAWFAENHVAANLLMALFVIGGFVSLPQIPKTTFPDIDVDMITVSVEYRGAAPAEVEEGVCSRIEEAVDGVDSVEEIRSTAMEGVCIVSAELISGADVAKALDDVKNRVDSITTFPEETEKPIITKVTPTRPVVDLALHGDVDERTLKELARRVRDDLAALPGITQVEILGTRDYEIAIEVSESALRRHGLTFDQVASAVRRSSLDLPGGSIKTESGEILLRTKGQAYTGSEFERLVLLTRADGTRLTLGDELRVVDGFQDVDRWATFDGRPAAIVRVLRVGDQSVFDISEAVKAYVAQAATRLPAGVELTPWQKEAEMLADRLEILMRNGYMGFALVLLSLALFLRLRLAIWVALGVPISFAGAIFAMGPLGIGIDGVSVFGFLLVLGILVDDAIVVGENVYTQQVRTGDRLRGAILGAQEVAVPVIFGVLTSVVTFMPMLLVDGMIGQMFAVMGAVIIACLLFSLAESMLVLPAHLGHGRPLSGQKRGSSRSWVRVQERFAQGLERFTHGPYRRLLERTLEWRYAAVAGAVMVLLWTVAGLAGGRFRYSFFPPLEADRMIASLTMPEGTPAARTVDAAAQILAALRRLQEELDPEYAPEGESLVRHVMVLVGMRIPGGGGPEGGDPSAERSAGSHIANISVELTPGEERAIGTRQLEKRWRELTGPIPGAQEVVFSSALFSAGDAIDLQLQSYRIDDLVDAAERLKARLAEYPGVLDISDSFRGGKPELKLAIRPAAESLGLSLSDLARQVRQAFYGEEVQRIQRGRDDVRVMVRYPKQERRSLGDLESMRIRAADGTEIAFGSVARVEYGRGFATIRRTNRQRVVHVTADIDRSRVTEGEVLAHLQAGPLPEILRDYPGMTVSLEGQQREERQLVDGLMRWVPMALFLVYALLAIPLRSYFQPLIIMSVIPFGLIGALAGHVILNRTLSMVSVIGILALSGVVVNASLILVHYINRRRADGVPLVDAVRDAALARLRPIVLTAITTFVGLTPLMLERSVQARFMNPMAVSLAWGVLFATSLTLLIVPAAYLITEDLRSLIGRRRRT